MITAWSIITAFCFVGYLVGMGFFIRDLIQCRWNFQTIICIFLMSIVSIFWVEVGFEIGKFLAYA